MSKELQENSSVELPDIIMKRIEKVCKEMKLDEEKKKKLIEKVKKEYMRCAFEPGEAIGIIAAQSISEPATQMCLDYSEKIIIKEKGRIFRLPIGLFVDRLMNACGYQSRNGIDVIDLPEDLELYALSMNSREKLVWKRIKSCVRLRNSEKLVKITTRSGRKVLASKSHSFIVRRNNRLVSVKGSDLREGMRIPVIRFLPHNSLETIEIEELEKEMRLDELFGFFLGTFVSEGYANTEHGIVSISNLDEEFMRNVRKFLEMFDFNYKEYFHERRFGKSRDLFIYSYSLSKFLKNNFGGKSSEKKIPNFVLSANENFVSGFLRAVFDGDGNIDLRNKLIRISSKSEELIDGIKILLNRFGIFSHKFKSKKNFHLHIPYKYAEIFSEKIGSCMRSKKKKLEKLVEISKKLKVESIEFYDLIPNFGNLLYELAKKLNYPTRYVNSFTKRQKIGRETLKRYIRLFENLSEKKGIDVRKELEILKQMANSDVVWDEIVRIEEVKPSTNHIYDISVEDEHNFTTFDGIVVHNTMRTYHVAGSAGVKVTYGLPRLIEIFDAKKQPETPFMTIYLKREYNNQETARKLAKEIVEKRLENLVKEITINLGNGWIEIEPEDLRKMDKIAKTIREKMSGTKVRKVGKKIIVIPKESDMRTLRMVKEKLRNMVIEGIKGIENAIVRKEGKDWIINTIGSNLEEIMKIKEVDETRTITNDLHETQRVLGIEAARNLIIREALNTMQEQGLNVDPRHVILVADIMTFRGKVMAIGRYGVAGSKPSVLARAAFEETIKHLVRASIRHESEEFKGIFENVMIGQVIPSGTGMFDLIARFGEEE